MENIYGFLSIVSFAFSFGGLASIIIAKDPFKERVVTIVIAVLLVTSGIAWKQGRDKVHLINQVQSEISVVLSNETLTFDQLYQDIHLRPYPLVNEALFRAVDEGKIGHSIRSFQMNGKTQIVRVYFVKTQ